MRRTLAEGRRVAYRSIVTTIVLAAAACCMARSGSALQVESGDTRRPFPEPRAPLGAPAAEETRQLAAVLDAYRSAADIEAVEPIVDFLRAHPDSAWRPSLLANLAVLYRRTGYIERSLDAAREAWLLTRSSSAAGAPKIADTALAAYVELTAALGRTAELAALLDEIKGRPLTGHAAETVSNARTR